MKISIEFECERPALVWREAEVSTHPRGGYTLKVPLANTARSLYVGEFPSERAARGALSFHQSVG